MFNSFFSKNENDLDGHQFKDMFENSQNAVLLDVRTPGEFAGGSIKGAKNVDFMAAAFQSTIKNLDPNSTYFVFCRSGNRSGSAAKQMKNIGLKVYNLVGGVGEWPK